MSHSTKENIINYTKTKGWKGKKRAKLWSYIQRKVVAHRQETKIINILDALVAQHNTHKNWYRKGDAVYIIKDFLINVGWINKER